MAPPTTDPWDVLMAEFADRERPANSITVYEAAERWGCSHSTATHRLDMLVQKGKCRRVSYTGINQRGVRQRMIAYVLL